MLGTDKGSLYSPIKQRCDALTLVHRFSILQNPKPYLQSFSKLDTTNLGYCYPPEGEMLDSSVSLENKAIDVIREYTALTRSLEEQDPRMAVARIGRIALIAAEEDDIHMWEKPSGKQLYPIDLLQPLSLFTAIHDSYGFKQGEAILADAFFNIPISRRSKSVVVVKDWIAGRLAALRPLE